MLRPDCAVDARRNPDEALVNGEGAFTADLIAAVEECGVGGFDDTDRFIVVAAYLADSDAIGAIGPTAPLDDIVRRHLAAGSKAQPDDDGGAALESRACHDDAPQPGRNVRRRSPST